MWLAYSELFENHVLEKIIEQAGRKKKPCRGRHDDHATLPSHISVSSTGTSSNVEVSVKCNAGEAGEKQSYLVSTKSAVVYGCFCLIFYSSCFPRYCRRNSNFVNSAAWWRPPWTSLWMGCYCTCW